MNRKNLIVFFALLLTALVLWVLWPKSTYNRLNVDLSGVENKLEIKHFDDAFFGTSPAELPGKWGELINEYAPFFESNPNPAFWLERRSEKAPQLLYADLKKVMPDFERLDKRLFGAFNHLYYYYPEYPATTLYTYISNLDFDYPILYNDPYVFVATDLYLGKEHPAYSQQASYLNYNRQWQFLATDVMEQIAFNINAKDVDDNSLLNEMIWWGKLIYFTEAMLPETNDTSIIRYNSRQLRFCVANEQEIWTYFVDNELLFNTLDEPKRKFIQPAPYSKFGMPFDNETPGMIGRWLGWQTVRSYMAENPNVSLPQLMANPKSREIFRNSKYKP